MNSLFYTIVSIDIINNSEKIITNFYQLYKRNNILVLK